MKGSTFAGVLIAAGLIGGAIYLNEGELSSANLRQIRVPCEKATPELCPGGVNKLGDYCLCRTLEKEEVADEVTADKIPLKDHVKVILCCNWMDEDTGKIGIRVGRTKGPIPVGCSSLTNNIVMDASSNNVWLEIDDVMSLACCGDCRDDCWIKPGHHGMCPHCLCDGTCGDYCPKPEPKPKEIIP